MRVPAVQPLSTSSARADGIPTRKPSQGLTLLWAGEQDEALAELRKGGGSQPGYAEAHNDLGVALIQMGRYAAAVPHLLKYLETYPDSAEVRLRHALRLATEQENLPLAEILAARVELYQASLHRD